MNMNEKAIRRIFTYYVAGMQEKEYHGDAALAAEDALETVMDAHIDNLDVWTEIIVKALNLANEYEEDGFVAGFRAAMQMLSSGFEFEYESEVV